MARPITFSLLILLTGPSVSQAALFAGTGNITVPMGGKNWAYEIEAEVLFAGFAATGPIDTSQTTNIWGAAWDGADTIFFSSPDGSGAVGPAGSATYLWSYSISDGATGPCSLGACYTEIGQVTVPTGEELRMDGLAFADGTLYAWNQSPMINDPGLYEVDLTGPPTGLFIGSPPPAFGDIKGIDSTDGIIYGIDDASNSVVTIDSATGGISLLANYPAGGNDFDGLAAGDGKLFLVGAGAFQDIEVLDLLSLNYLPSQPGVFPFDDDFSGAAYFERVPEPTTGLMTFLGLLGLATFRRRS